MHASRRARNRTRFRERDPARESARDPDIFSGSLSLSLCHSPNLLTKPLFGSQGPCSALSVATAQQHFYQPWRGQKAELEKKKATSLLWLKLHLFRIGAQSGFEGDSGANLTQHAKVWKGIGDWKKEN